MDEIMNWVQKKCQKLPILRYLLNFWKIFINVSIYNLYYVADIQPCEPGFQNWNIDVSGNLRFFWNSFDWPVWIIWEMYLSATWDFYIHNISSFESRLHYRLSSEVYYFHLTHIMIVTLHRFDNIFYW